MLAHGPIETLAENVFTVVGDIRPGRAIKRRMTVIRRPDRTLWVHSAIRLDETRANDLDALGHVGAIVVPSVLHRIDAPHYAARYPEAKVIAPRGARAGVASKVRVDATYDEQTAADDLRIEHLDGTGEKEGVLTVRSTDGVTLVFNDAVMNLPDALPGLEGFIFGALGSLGGPKVTWIYRTVVMKDRRALAAHLQRLAETPSLKRVVPGHGPVIDQDPAGTLARVAKLLAG